MLNIIQNTIGAIRRVGESVVRAGLKMWLPFTKAEPLGENLVTNGDFATDSDWDKLNGATISDGRANFIGDGSSFTNINQDGVFTDSKFYKIVADVTIVSGEAKLQQFGYNESIGAITQSGVHTFYYTAISDSGLNIGRRTPNNSFEFYVNNVTVEEYAQETPDISGNNNNAILKTGKCLVFHANDSIETSFPTSKDIKTIAFWIYPTASNTNETLFWFGGSSFASKYVLLNHLTLTSSPYARTDFDVYVDGVFAGATFGGQSVTLVQDQWQRVVFKSSTAINVVSDTFNVAEGAAAGGSFKMSDLQIYGAEFTTDDIAYDYANPQSLVTDNASSNVTLNDLHAWWHMSEGDGTIAFDSAPLIGKELVVNGDFATDSDWYTPTGWSIENGKATKSGTSINGLRQAINLPIARVFQLTFEVSGKTSGNLLATIFGGGGSDEFFNYQIENGSHSFTTTSTVNRTHFQFYAYGGFDGSIDNVSIKEVFNIDGETYDGSALGATYDDAQERIPQLGMMNWSKGSNALQYSNDFSNSHWSINGVDLDSGYIAPDGTATAYKVSKTGSGILFDTNVSTNVGVIRSIWAKTVSGTGTVHLTSNNGNANSLFTITNDWQRFSVTSGLQAPHTFYAVDFRDTANTTLSEVIIWGAQEEVNVGDSLSAFRKTNGTAVTNATLISCATDSQKDILGNAVRVKGSGFNLDGTGYGEVEHNTDFDFGTGDFSVSAWVKFSYVAKGSSFNAIYTNGGQLDGANTFSLISHSVMKIMVLVNTTDCQSTTTFSQGEWVYVVATRNSGTISIYINGNKTPEQTKNTTNTNATVTSFQNPRIGFDGIVSRLYNDIIDDVQVYDRYLTPDEIEQNYNATKSGHNN